MALGDLLWEDAGAGVGAARGASWGETAREGLVRERLRKVEFVKGRLLLEGRMAEQSSAPLTSRLIIRTSP